MTQAEALLALGNLLYSWAEKAEFWTSLVINILAILGFIAWAADPKAKVRDGSARWAFVVGTFFRLAGVAVVTIFNLILFLAITTQPGLLGITGWVFFVIFMVIGVFLLVHVIWRFKGHTE